MARKPDEITVASLQQYLEDLQGEFNELKEENEGEEDDERDEQLEALEMRIDSVEAALNAIDDVQ